MRRSMLLIYVALIPIGVGFCACGGSDDGNGGTSMVGSGHRFGARLPSRAEVSTYAAAISGVGANGEALPAAFDLTSDLPPIGDQGQLNSCVAWAEGYGMLTYEAGRKEGWDVSTADHQASPADLYSDTLHAMQLPCDDGTDPKTAMDLLVRDGIESLAQIPYADSCPLPTPAPGSFAIKAWHSVSTDDTTALKRQLVSRRVVPFATTIDTELPTWEGSGVFTGSGNTIAGEGHMMVLVGYDDALGAWRVMNSWGTSWGDGGFFWLAYDTFQSDAIVAVVADLGVADHAPTDAKPQLQAVVIRQFFDAVYGKHFLFAGYALSEPMYLAQARLTSNGVTAASSSAAAWLEESYVWVAADTAFPAGHYLLTLTGTSRNGQAVALSAQVTLDAETTVAAFSEQRPAASSAGGWVPGATVVMNGQPIALQSE